MNDLNVRATDEAWEANRPFCYWPKSAMQPFRWNGHRWVKNI